MTDPRFFALHRAVQEYLQGDYEGDTVISFVVVTQSQTLDRPGSNYRLLADEDQPFHVTSGLLDVGTRVLDDIWNDDDE